jgi:uncharacterized protein
MKKRFILKYVLSALMLLPGMIQAQEQEQSVLWEISGNGLKSPSYLFGTIHVISEKDYFFTDVMKRKFDECNTLAMELDLNIPILKQLEIAQRTMLPKGRTLEDYMSEQDFGTLSSYMLDSLHIKLSKFNKYIKLKPLFLSSVIASAGMGKTVTYEKVFNKRAKKRGMSTLGLETMEFQLSLIDKTSIEDQVKGLLEELRTTKESKALLDTMIIAYKAQDVDKLYSLISAGSGETEGFMKDYLVDRNIKWVPEIQEIAGE